MHATTPHATPVAHLSVAPFPNRAPQGRNQSHRLRRARQHRVVATVQTQHGSVCACPRSLQPCRSANHSPASNQCRAVSTTAQHRRQQHRLCEIFFVDAQRPAPPTRRSVRGFVSCDHPPQIHRLERLRVKLRRKFVKSLQSESSLETPQYSPPSRLALPSQTHHCTHSLLRSPQSRRGRRQEAEKNQWC